MMRLRTVMIGLLAFGLIGSMVAFAQQGPVPPGPGDKDTDQDKGLRGYCGAGPGGFPPLLRGLGKQLEKLPDMLKMDEAQRGKYRPIAEKHRAEVKRLLKELRQQTTKFRAQMNEILTPEQQEKLKQMRQRMHRRMGKGQHPSGRGRMLGLRPRLTQRALELLDISEEKKDKIKELVNAAREKCKSIDREQKRFRGAVREIFTDMSRRIREVLSAEEFNQLKQKVKELSGKAHKKWGRHGKGHKKGYQSGARRGGDTEDRPYARRSGPPSHLGPRHAATAPPWLW